jgi:hypothetical protein
VLYVIWFGMINFLDILGIGAISFANIWTQTLHLDKMHMKQAFQ